MAERMTSTESAAATGPGLGPDLAHYLCEPDEIEYRIGRIDPRAYDRTRNQLQGSVTWLSPFLTHGIIDTTSIAEGVLNNNKPTDCYRLLFELAWREYFHRVWQQQGDGIFHDMRQVQAGVQDDALPLAIMECCTGIHVVDRCLEHLQREGLMHNHARLWVAAMVCNMAHTYWYEPARWLHYHLLDGDLASNTLSWQWVAGTFSHKVYVANQANINKYSQVNEVGTWLDVPYKAFEDFAVPDALVKRAVWQELEDRRGNAQQQLPGKPVESLVGSVALHSLWSLNGSWYPEAEQRILFVDTDWNHRWPLSEKRWHLVKHWAKQAGLQIYHGTVDDLRAASAGAKVVRREYPACQNWPGDVEERRWLYPMPDKPFSSFSQFWKQVRGSAGL